MIVTPFDTLAELRFQRHVEYLHRLGPSAVGELIAEIGEVRSVRSLIDRKLADYARLDPEILRALGGDRFPPRVFLAGP